MFAVFEDGSRQYSVSEGDVVRVDYRNMEVGDEIVFDRVLLYRNEGDLQIGQPVLAGARVVAEVIDHPSEKYYIQHYRRTQELSPVQRTSATFTAGGGPVILRAGENRRRMRNRSKPPRRARRRRESAESMSPLLPGDRPAPRRRRAGRRRRHPPAKIPRAPASRPRPDRRRTDAARLPRNPPRETDAATAILAWTGAATSACRTAPSLPISMPGGKSPFTLRELRPRIMFAPFWEDAHPDHVAASQLIDAARSGPKLTKTDMAGEPFYPHRIIYYFSVHLRLHVRPSFVLGHHALHRPENGGAGVLPLAVH